MTKKMKVIIIILWGILALSFLYFGVIYFARFHQDPKIALNTGVLLEESLNVPKFELVTEQGESFQETDLEGHWSLLFLGLTHCRYDCSRSLEILNLAYQRLEQHLSKDKLPSLFIIGNSIKPEDEKISDELIKLANPHFIVLRSSSSQINAWEKTLQIATSKRLATDPLPSHYILEHTPELIMIDPQGKIKTIFKFPESSEHLASDYMKIVSATKN